MLATPRRVALAAAVAVSLGAAPAVCSATVYAATKLVTSTGDPVVGEALNNVGQNSGHAGVVTAWRAVGYIKTGSTMTTFNLTGARFCTTTTMNDSGDIAGVCTINYNDRAFYKPKGGAVQDLFAAYPGSMDEAYGINTYKKIVGTHRATPSSSARAFLYNPATGKFTWLGDLGGINGVGMAINDNDTVVGYSFDTSHTRRAFIWSGGHISQLPSLGVGFDTAYSINQLGTVVGRCGTTSFSVTTGCMWLNGQVSDLGGLGGSNGGADAINDSGTIVGWSVDGGGVQRAVIFSGGTAHDMNAMLKAPIGSRLTEAIAINASGVIIAIDNLGNSWLLTPQ